MFRLFRPLILVLLATIATSCAALKRQDRPAIATDDGSGRRVEVLVATTRVPDRTLATSFTSDRSEQLLYARYIISIPPNHVPSGVELAAFGAPDPKTSFAIVEATPLSEAEFRRIVARSAATARGSAPTAAVFVHGYNYTFQESLFRAAQIYADADLGGAQILFAWPSDGSPLGYIADKDAADFSRNDLAHVLDVVASEPRVGAVAVLGHSMGSWLVMESLRQLRLSGEEALFRKLLAAMLAAPDIDINVFAKQLEVVGRTSPPMVVLVAPDDAALSLSGKIAGDRFRVGSVNVDDTRVQQAARQFGVRVVDVSSLAPGELAHGRYEGIASIYPRLRQELEDRRGGGEALKLRSDTGGPRLGSPALEASRPAR